jgi:hypothetical protein
MSMAEVADRLGAALDDYARARVAEALVATGELASVKIGKLRRIPIGALNDFIRVRLKEGSTVST